MNLSDIPGNIEWTKVKRRIYNGEDIVIIGLSTGWVCCLYDRPEAVINWSSSDATEAQTWLAKTALEHSVYKSQKLHLIRKRYDIGA